MQNESTPGARGPVFCGVDTHADSHWLCVLDWRGRRVLSRRFPADAAGYEALAGAIAAAGEPACVAMEGTSSYGAGLTRHLASLGMPVRDEAQAQQGRRPAGEQRAARDREAEGHARPRDRRVRREDEGAGEERQGGHEVPQALRGQGGVPGADAPARDQEARGRLGARGGQARGEGQPGEGGVHTGHQREVHLDAGEGPKGAQAHKEGLRGVGRGGAPARLGQAGVRGRAQNGF